MSSDLSSLPFPTLCLIGLLKILKYLARNARTSLPPSVLALPDRVDDGELEVVEVAEGMCWLLLSVSPRGGGGRRLAGDDTGVALRSGSMTGTGGPLLMSRGSALLLISAPGEVPSPDREEAGEEAGEEVTGGRVRCRKGEDVLDQPGSRVGVEAERVATGMLNALLPEEC